jgi:site-specific DNA recombinase
MEPRPETHAVVEKAQALGKRWNRLGILERHEITRAIVKRVVVSQTIVWTEVDRAKLAVTLGHNLESLPSSQTQGTDVIKVKSNFQSLRRGNELRMIAADDDCKERTPVPSLVKALARARCWYEQIVLGEENTVSDIAQKTGFHLSYVRRILQCAALSPQVTELILSGKQRPSVTLRDLTQTASTCWAQQITNLGEGAKTR